MKNNYDLKTVYNELLDYINNINIDNASHKDNIK